MIHRYLQPFEFDFRTICQIFRLKKEIQLIFHSLHLFYFAASYCLLLHKDVNFKSECVLIKIKHDFTDYAFIQTVAAIYKDLYLYDVVLLENALVRKNSQAISVVNASQTILFLFLIVQVSTKKLHLSFKNFLYFWIPHPTVM